MMAWRIVTTRIFSQKFKKYKRDKEFIDALNYKIERLKQDPENIGGYLSGRLQGYKSTRIIRKFRLIFKVIKKENSVYLIAIDHRKFDYKRF